MPLVETAHIDMDEVHPALQSLLRAKARLYMHFANTVIDAFGQAGEMTVRYHLRELGKFRGTEMREAHNAMGKEINMATLTLCWDNASTYIIDDDMEQGTYTPYDSRFDVHFCPAAQVWKAAGFHRWGHVYCDEFHQACASNYHPDGNVVIPINMMKGDDHCEFRWIMPATAREIDYTPPSPLGLKLAKTYESSSPAEGARNAMLRTSRLIGGTYLTMVGPLFDRHPEAEASEVRTRFLTTWATQRGELLREDHEARGIEISPANLLREMDLCTKFVWEIEDEELSDDHYAATIAWTPMDECFADYGAAAHARVFWEVTLPAMAAGYDPSLRVELTQLRWRGDATTRVRISRV